MKNQIERLDKVKKSCKVAGTIVTILNVIIWIGTALSFIGSIGCLIARDYITELVNKVPSSVYLNMRIEFFGLDLEYLPDQNAGLALAAGCLIIAIGLLFFAIALHHLGKTFKLINKGESPFTEEVTRTMKIAFIMLVIFVFFTSGLIMAVFAAIVLWCIYNIFQYGIILQKESDETI